MSRSNPKTLEIRVIRLTRKVDFRRNLLRILTPFNLYVVYLTVCYGILNSWRIAYSGFKIDKSLQVQHSYAPSETVGEEIGKHCFSEKTRTPE